MVLYKKKLQNIIIFLLISCFSHLEADNTIPKDFTINYYSESPYFFQSGKTRYKVSAIEFFADKDTKKNVKFFLNGIPHSSQEISLLLHAITMTGGDTPLVIVYSGGEKSVLNELELMKKKIHELQLVNFRIIEIPDLEILLKNKNQFKVTNSHIVTIELKKKNNNLQDGFVQYWIQGKPWDKLNALKMLGKMSKSQNDNIVINIVYTRDLAGEKEELFKKCKVLNFPYITKTLVANKDKTLTPENIKLSKSDIKSAYNKMTSKNRIGRMRTVDDINTAISLWGKFIKDFSTNEESKYLKMAKDKITILKNYKTKLESN